MNEVNMANMDLAKHSQLVEQDNLLLKVSIFILYRVGSFVDLFIYFFHIFSGESSKYASSD